MKKTFREVNIFVGTANAYMARNPARTKLTYAISRLQKRLQPLLIEHNEKLEDAAIDHCLTDDKGALLLTDDGAYTFDKPGIHARNKTIREALLRQVEFEPFYVADTPEDLMDSEIAAFEGFVIREEDEAVSVTEAASPGANSGRHPQAAGAKP